MLPASGAVSFSLSPASILVPTHGRSTNSQHFFYYLLFNKAGQSQSLWRWFKISASNQNGFKTVLKAKQAGENSCDGRWLWHALPHALSSHSPPISPWSGVAGSPARGANFYHILWRFLCLGTIEDTKGKTGQERPMCFPFSTMIYGVRATVFTKCFKMCQKILVIQLVTGHVNVNSLIHILTVSWEISRRDESNTTGVSYVFFSPIHSQDRSGPIDLCLSQTQALMFFVNYLPKQDFFKRKIVPNKAMLFGICAALWIKKRIY